ncbi:MAG: IPTL-CTERM sorting domain-containing protein [Thermodesulfobacteriota bacterium]
MTNNADTVSVIDTSTNTVINTIPVGMRPTGVAVTPDGMFVYVNNSNDGTVSVIRTSTNTVVDTVPVGMAPEGVAVTPDGMFVYVADFDDDTVSVIRTSTNTVVDTVPVWYTPFSFGIFIIPPPPPSPAMVPTLSEWGLIAMAGVLGIVGFMVMRRRKATA